MRYLFSNTAAILFTIVALIGVSLSIHDDRPATTRENQIAYWSLGSLAVYLASAGLWHHLQRQKE